MHEDRQSNFNAHDDAFDDLTSSSAFKKVVLRDLVASDLAFEARRLVDGNDEDTETRCYYQLTARAIVRIELWAQQDDFHLGSIEQNDYGNIVPFAAKLGLKVEISSLEEYLGLA